MNAQRWMVFEPPKFNGRPRLLISFSGGRTSGYMTRQILTRMAGQFDIKVVFANTGEENEATLEFVRDCDEQFGFGTVWVEAVVAHGERKGSGHRVVTFETASRKGEPFEDVIKKYGIPNKGYPHCTRETKLNPIWSYLDSIGWTDYMTAIGIRPDEARRVDEKQLKLAHQGHAVKIVYPLIEWFYADKQDVNDWWEDQPFNLNLLEHQGNCKWCWKKSDAKHARLLVETPEIFEFPARMEALYSMVGARTPDDVGKPRFFFRGHTSTANLAAKVFAINPEPRRFKDHPDENGGCAESCEMYPMLDLEAA